jgi:hypothetical protein
MKKTVILKLIDIVYKYNVSEPKIDTFWYASISFSFPSFFSSPLPFKVACPKGG